MILDLDFTINRGIHLWRFDCGSPFYFGYLLIMATTDCTEAASYSVEKDDVSWYCPHCEEFVSKTTYYRHRKRFFNHLENTWEIPGVAETTSTLLQEPEEQFSNITCKLSRGGSRE